MEEQRSRKDAVKNAAIIFLSILLLLTLFSNTIMNYTLPQVSTVYPQPNMVSQQVKGSGTVEYAQSVEVKTETAKEVKEVYVKNGDMVKAGDLLFVLDTSSTSTDESSDDYRDDTKVASSKTSVESAEKSLRDAISDLEDKEYQYSKALIYVSDPEASYAADQLEIDNAKTELERLKKQLSDIENGKDELSLVTKEYDEAKAEYDELKRKKDSYTAMMSSADTEDMTELDKADYDKLSAAKKKVSDCERAVTKATNDSKDVNDEYSTKTSDKNDEISQAQADIRTKQALIDNTYAKIAGTKLEDDISTYYSTIYTYESEITKLRNDIEDLSAKIQKYQLANAESDKAKKAIKEATEKVRKAENALLDAKDELAKVKREIKVGIKKKLDEITPAFNEAETKYNNMQTKKTEVAASGGLTKAQAETKINEQELTIKKLEVALEKKKSDASVEAQKSDITKQKDISDKQHDVEKAREKVTQARTDLASAKAEYDENVVKAKEKIEKNEAKKQREKEVKASISGEIENISVTEGSKVEAGSVLAKINAVDLGMKVEFTCSAEQASKVRVGDLAEVTSWYIGESIEARLTEIRSDKSEPQSKKVLVFNISGTDLSAGQSISLALGSKGQQYQTTLPNNAIRDDSTNGKYVFVLESKSTPLGNRYTAVKVSVDVVAKDDNYSAVNGLSGSEFVITTSSKPLNAGEQVRLADQS